MYRIEKLVYGYRLIFADEIRKPEMSQWVAESGKILETQTGAFGVFVDMRTLKPLSEFAKDEMTIGQKLYKAKGMERSVVILSSTVITLQFRSIAQKSGIYQWERYIDASKCPDWEVKGLRWILKGIDPEK